jgi:DNA repair protein RadC
MPSEERPRERLERCGVGTLTNADLLAILLRVGSTRENVIELAGRLLREFGGLGGLLVVDLPLLCATHGMGLAKATQVKATLELARWLNLLTPEVRPQIKSPGDVVNLLRLWHETSLCNFPLLALSTWAITSTPATTEWIV